jgi:ssDNA-binding Zn-finger/Zn-ribbon topoisomerase 1
MSAPAAVGDSRACEIRIRMARMFHRWREKRLFRERAIEEAVRFQRAVNDFSENVKKVDAEARRELRETAGSPPACPTCGASLRIRVASRGQNAGHQFWGCRRYPECRYAADVDRYEPTRFLLIDG